MGKILTVPPGTLSKENGELLSKKDLKNGANVIYESSNGKTYDVTILMLYQ